MSQCPRYLLCNPRPGESSCIAISCASLGLEQALLEKLVHQMKLYFDAAVWTPIRQLGITDSIGPGGLVEIAIQDGTVGALRG